MRGFGYDIDSVMEKQSLTIVDICGGQGQVLLKIIEAYSRLSARNLNLNLQEFNADANPRSGLGSLD